MRVYFKLCKSAYGIFELNFRDIIIIVCIHYSILSLLILNINSLGVAAAVYLISVAHLEVGKQVDYTERFVKLFWPHKLP